MADLAFTTGSTIDFAPVERTNLYAALVRAQAKIEAVAKDAKNKFQGYDYASSEAIIEEARKALSEAGLAVFPIGQSIIGPLSTPAAQSDDKEERKPPGPHEVSSVLRTFRLAESVSCEYQDTAFSWPVVPEKGRPADKALASALTSSLAYYLRDLLLMPRGVSPTDDMDHESRDNGRREQRKTPRRNDCADGALVKPGVPATGGTPHPLVPTVAATHHPSAATKAESRPAPVTPVQAGPAKADKELDQIRKATHAYALRWTGRNHDELKDFARERQMIEDSTNEMGYAEWSELLGALKDEVKAEIAEAYPTHPEGSALSDEKRASLVGNFKSKRKTGSVPLGTVSSNPMSILVPHSAPWLIERIKDISGKCFLTPLAFDAWVEQEHGVTDWEAAPQDKLKAIHGQLCVMALNQGIKVEPKS